jgi:hypothetical protein
MNSLIDDQLKELSTAFPGSTAVARPDGSRLIQIPNFPLPKGGWNAEKTTVYFVVVASYPVAKPDCFWTDPTLRLATGAPPQNSSINDAAGLGAHQLLWFSWHIANWNPSTDTLLTYARVIERRFHELR